MISNIYRLFFYNLFGVKRRSSRKEFISRFIMMWFLTGYMLLFVDQELEPYFYSLSASYAVKAMSVFILFFLLLPCCLMLQFFFLMHRRIHDLGYSGWWQLLFITPICPFFILVLMVIKGEEGKNKYGYPPEF